MDMTSINGIELQNENKIEKLILNNKIILLILILVLGILFCLWLLGLNIEKQKQLNQKITNLQEQIDTFEKQKIIRVVPTKISEERENVEAKPTIDPAIYTCQYWEDKVFNETEFDSPAGTLIVSGSIVKKDGIKYFSEDEKLTRVYLVVSEQKENPQKLFYEYYRGLVEGKNSINDMEDQKVLFKIGMLENSKFIPGSVMSDSLKNKIMSLIDKNEIIKLKLTIGIPPGRSGGDGESFACVILE